MKLIFLFFSVLAFSACIKISDKDSDAPAPQEAAMTIPPAVYEISQNVQFKELPEPNRYQIAIRIPEKGDQIEKWEKGFADKRSLLDTAQLSGVFLDDQIVAGKTYVYRWVPGSSRSVSDQQVEISVPVDLDLQTEATLQKDETWTGYHRIFLGPQGILTTNGHHLVIQTDQIISNGGLIQTFHADSQAKGSSGASGGSLKIHATTGQGILKVIMRGQQGSNGIGLPSGIGAKGLDGYQGGNSGSGDFHLKEAHRLQLQITVEKGKGGQGLWTTDFCPQGADAPYCDGEGGKPGAAGHKETFCVQDLKGQTCSTEE